DANLSAISIRVSNKRARSIGSYLLAINRQAKRVESIIKRVGYCVTLTTADQVNTVDLPSAEHFANRSLLILECWNIPDTIDREDVATIKCCKALFRTEYVECCLRKRTSKPKADHFACCVERLRPGVRRTNSKLVEQTTVVLSL